LSHLRVIIESRSDETLEVHLHFHILAHPTLASAAAYNMLEAIRAHLAAERIPYDCADARSLCTLCYPPQP
jgi:hypothetical protein